MLKDAKLISALAAYPPAIAIEFTESELEDLHQFSGRASHAESRAGLQELRRVRSEICRREGRLKNLAERVLLTKMVWGSRSPEVEELLRLGAWIEPLSTGENRFTMFASKTRDADAEGDRSE